MRSNASPRLGATLTLTPFLFTMCFVKSAAAADTPPAPDSVEASWADLRARQVDVKADLRTSALVQYAGIGASGDVGVARLGPGTLALGGGIAYEACGSTCWDTPLGFTQHQTMIEARGSYHLVPGRIRYLDIHPLVTLGVAFAGSTIHVGDSEYRGSSVAPTVGFGAGATWFFAQRFFVSAEATLRWAAGSYDYELARGPSRPFDRSGVDATWPTTIALAIGAGARF